MESKDRERELLFISQVARLHGLSADAVRDDIRRGLLKAILTANGTRLIRREDAERRARERAAERIAHQQGLVQAGTMSAPVQAEIAIMTADEIDWGYGGLSLTAPPPSPDALIALACEMLPGIDDHDLADLVELLASALADQYADQWGRKLIQSELLTLFDENQRDLSRVRGRYHELLDQRRAAQQTRS